MEAAFTAFADKNYSSSPSATYYDQSVLIMIISLYQIVNRFVHNSRTETMRSSRMDEGSRRFTDAVESLSVAHPALPK